MKTVWPSSFSPNVVRPFFGRLSCYTIALEAWRRGLEVTAIDGNLRKVRISDPQGHSVTFHGSRPSMTSARAIRTARDKHKTASILRSHGFPAPESVHFHVGGDTEKNVILAAEELGWPVVIKPVSGTKGTGVFTNISTAKELREYYHYLVDRLHCKEIVLESHERGDEDLRVLVVGDRIAGVCKRLPANITGDGLSTITDLIKEKNSARENNPFLSSGKIYIDDEVLNYVTRAGHTLDSILPKGEKLVLRGKSNGSTGGDTIDATGLLPKHIQGEIIRAVQSIPELHTAGVDILYSKEEPGYNSFYSIIEINATPQIGLNMYPIYGQGQDVPKIWIDTYFPSSERPSAKSFETLTFSLQYALAAIGSGAVESATFTRPPKNGLPDRNIFNFVTTEKLTSKSARRLRQFARKLGVAGDLSSTKFGYRLRVAAENDGIQKQLLNHTSELLATRPSEPERWEGVVEIGFYINL